MAGKEYYKKGIQLLNDGKWEEALAQFNKALDLEPDHPDYLSDRAVSYFQLNKKDLAIFDLNRAQLLDPHNPYRYSSRAYVKDSLGDTHGAITDYKKAIELDPEDAVAYNNLGMLEEKIGYDKQAKERFKKADSIADKNYSSPSDHLIEMSKQEKKEKVEENIEEPKRSKWHFMKYGILNANGRKEFIRFIKNGFKLK